MATKPTGDRLLSLDAFRGATIAGMILVNNSGDYDHTWWPLLHQPWHGWTLLFTLGLLWGEAAPAWLVFPVNKNLWSPSFVLLTAGLASTLFGLAWWLVDAHGRRSGIGPLVTYGKNPIAVYVGSEILSGAWGTIAWASAGGRVLTLQERMHQLAFASWLPPVLAAFAFAFANVVLWWAVARWMDRRGIYLKV